MDLVLTYLCNRVSKQNYLRPDNALYFRHCTKRKYHTQMFLNTGFFFFLCPVSVRRWLSAGVTHLRPLMELVKSAHHQQQYLFIYFCLSLTYFHLCFTALVTHKNNARSGYKYTNNMFLLISIFSRNIKNFCLQYFAFHMTLFLHLKWYFLQQTLISGISFFFIFIFTK